MTGRTSQRRVEPCLREVSPILSDEEFWELTVSLPPVRKMMELGWSTELPPAIVVTFCAVSLASAMGLTGDSMWEYVKGTCQGALRYVPTPQQQEYIGKVDSYFERVYGKYRRTPKGMVKVLSELGMVVKRRRNGEEVLDIPDALPLPNSLIGSTPEDDEHSEPLTIVRTPLRGSVADRVRVNTGDLSEVRRMVDAGWARHLPIDIASMFLIVAAISRGGIGGAHMWREIKNLYSQTRKVGLPYIPPPKRKEIAKRFAEEYGKPYDKSARGVVDALVDLGLVERYDLDGEESLRVPEDIPSPDTRLKLSDHEQDLLAMRKGMS